MFGTRVLRSAMSSPYAYASQAKKILCVGRNYVDHIKELNSAHPQQPFYFLKPTSSILLPGQGAIQVPKGVNVHHELELAVIISKRLRNLDPETFTTKEALDSIDGYALSLDLTARNVQNEAKKKGLPWSISKGFDTFLPLSKFVPKSEIADPHNVHLKLEVNGKATQDDNTNLMIFRLPQLLAVMSQVMTLEPGDIILTGTPKGVGPLVPGDKVHGEMSVDGKKLDADLDFDVETEPGPYQYKET